MGATIIDGRAIAAQVREEVARDVAGWVAEGHDAPGLATVLVGDDPASAVYVGGKQKAPTRSACRIRPPAARRHAAGGGRGAPAGAQRGPARRPASCSSSRRRRTSTAGLTGLIDPAKDVDGLTPVSAGLLAKGRPGLRPCTPSGYGAARPLRRAAGGSGGGRRRALDLVGKPLAQLLLARHATVTICHSRTRDLPEVCRRADVLVAAVGRPRWCRATG